MVTRFVAGFAIGMVIGSAAALLTTPQSGSDLLDGARSWVDDILNEGRRAAAQRRAELEARVANLTEGRVS